MKQNYSNIFKYFLKFNLILFLVLSTQIPITSHADEIRAIWGTRWDYQSASEVQSMVNNIANHGFNVFLHQVRGNATVFYPSEIEPWAFELTGDDPSTLGTDPGWDPLQTAIDTAHARGLELHAYMNVYPGWRGTTPPPVDAQQLYNTHPDWFCVNSSGERIGLNSHYMPLSPGHPDVQDYLYSVFMEVVDNYPDLDGIHLDYIRYFGPTYSWDTASLEAFSQDSGGETPESAPALWNQWRRDQVTALVRRIYQGAHERHPDITVSVATWPSYTSGRDSYYQDAHAWMQEGILDVSFKMSYTTSLTTLQTRALECVENRGIRHAVPALGVHLLPNSPELMTSQIRAIRNIGSDGVTFFDYGTLFTNHQPNVLSNRLIENSFLFPDDRPPMLWLDAPEDDDPVPPRVFDPQTVPEYPTTSDSFRIQCRITDDSGVDPSSVEMQWAVDADPRIGGATSSLHLVSDDIYQSDNTFKLTSTEQVFYCQISASDLDTNQGADDVARRTTAILSFTVDSSPIYEYKEALGLLSGSPQFGAMDATGDLWICEYNNHQIQVLDTSGTPLPFSPVTHGINSDGESTPLKFPSGICASADGIIWVTLDDAYEEDIYALVGIDSANGQTLYWEDLSFRPGDCDSFDSGGLVITHKVEEAWSLWTSSPIIGPSTYTFTGNSYPDTAIYRGIACSRDGATVYHQALTGALTVWKRGAFASFIYHLQTDPLLEVGAQAGAVDLGSNEYLFIGDESNRVIMLYDTAGTLLQRMQLEEVSCIPRGVIPSPDADHIYVVPFGGDQRIQRWEKINNSHPQWSIH